MSNTFFAGNMPKPCPFCGGQVDPEGWAQESGFPDPPGVIERGPECKDCGATARTMEAWNRRAELLNER